MKRLLLAALMVSSSAHAEFYSGNILFQKLNSDNLYTEGIATGYVAGVFDATRNTIHCPGVGVTIGQVKDMVNKFLRENPAIRNETADGIVMFVLGQTFPCSKKSQL